ncbi:hypothetical protein GEMRC1_011245 [Eukaryota sp. GEM-RC1]
MSQTVQQRKQKPVEIGVKQSALLIQYADKYPHLKNTALALWAKETFNLPTPPHRTTIGKILKRRAQILEQAITLEKNLRPSAKRTRTVKYPELDAALALFVEMNSSLMTITEDVILAEAEKLYETLEIPLEGHLKHGDGWFSVLMREAEEAAVSDERDFALLREFDMTEAEFELMVNEDYETLTEGILSVEECLEQVTDNNQEIYDNHEEDLQPQAEVTRTEAYNALRALQSYVSANFHSKHASLYTLDEVERELEELRVGELRQRTLMHFLHSTNESHVIDIE